MSKYFIDVEFLEGTQKKWYGKTPPTIDLISIGIVAEDGREYYAISKDFNLKEAWNRWQQRTGQGDYNNIKPKVYWIRDNVLKPIYYDLMFGDSPKMTDEYFTYSTFKKLINKYGKTNNQIANEIVEFIYGESSNLDGLSPLQEAQKYEPNNHISKPQFYAYYADYDWVVFCWLFGKMIDLPKGFPMYCVDLKQTLDEKAWKIYCNNGTLDAEKDINKRIEFLKTKGTYPKQTNEHNALSDAIFCRDLYKFLNTIK